MSDQFLSSKMQLLFAKSLHDIAAPLGALNLCIEELQKALPESTDLIENSVELLNSRINYWRVMMTGSERFPNFADAATAIRTLTKLKSIKCDLKPANEYRGTYVRLLLALSMVAIESLPRGGQISIDADNGTVTAQGPKCYIHKDTQDAIIDNDLDKLSSRHALGLLINSWSKACNASVKLEHEPTKLSFILQGAII